MILYCCADLMFSSRVEGTARALGLPTHAVPDTEHLAAILTPGDAGSPPADRPPQALFVDLDLGEEALNLIRTARPAAPDLPIIAFGSHVEADQLREARNLGADPALPRSRFVQQLPHMLQRLADEGGAQQLNPRDFTE